MNRIFSNIVFLVVLNLLVKPLWIFGIELTVQNRVGAEEYGNYFALFNFVILFQILLDMGINMSNNREISRDSSLLPSYFSSIIAVKFILAIFYALAIYGVAFFLGYSAFQLKLLSFLMMGQVGLSYLLYFRSNLGALQLFKRDGFLSVFDKLLMIVILGAVLFGSAFSAEIHIMLFAQIQSFAFILTAVVGFLMIVKELKEYSLRPDFSKAVVILKKSYPFALLIFLMAIYNRIDGVMIERLLPNGKAEAGVYAAGYRLLDAVNQIGLLSSTVLYPVFSKLIADKQEVAGVAVRAAQLILVLAFVVCGSSFAFRSEIMHWLYWDATPYYADLFGCLIWSFLGIACTYVFGTLLTSGGYLKQLNTIALSGVAMNVVLNYLLIENFQALGATWATLITQSVIAGIFTILSFKYFKIIFSLRVLTKAILFGTFSLLLFFAAQHFQFTIWQIRFVLSAFLAALLGALIFGRSWLSLGTDLKAQR